MSEEKDKKKIGHTKPANQEGAEGQEHEEEVDPMDELLADVPEWLREPLKLYYKQILVTIALVVTVAVLWSGYSYYSQRQEEAASFQLGIAMATQDLNKKLTDLKNIIQKFSNTHAARIAELLLGQVYLQKADFGAALDTFKRAEGDFSGIMQDSAMMGQGYSQEELKHLQEALGLFGKVASRKNGMEAVAILDEARIYKALGKKEEAVKAYNKYLDMEPRSALLDFIRFQVMDLSS